MRTFSIYVHKDVIQNVKNQLVMTFCHSVKHLNLSVTLMKWSNGDALLLVVNVNLKQKPLPSQNVLIFTKLVPDGQTTVNINLLPLHVQLLARYFHSKVDPSRPNLTSNQPNRPQIDRFLRFARFQPLRRLMIKQLVLMVLQKTWLTWSIQ